MCLVSVAWAREDSVAEEELATVVVTASRFQEQEEEALSATTVITQQTIRNKQLADGLPSPRFVKIRITPPAAPIP